MNNNWITCSLNSYNANTHLVGKELWIDRMGLLETGWLLFAGCYKYRHQYYGYPGYPIIKYLNLIDV